MCGRYALTLPPEAVRSWFRYPEQPNFPARYNIAPTQPVPVVTIRQGERHFALMRWGFIPGFVRDEKTFPLVINIRSETAREKPSFRNAFRRRRCLVPANGFYEWQRIGKLRRPFLIARPDRGPFAFAGLYETWSSKDGSEIDTAAILTTHANGTVAAIHDRSPVVLAPEDYEAWLRPETPEDDAAALLRPPPDDLLRLDRVAPDVNKVANDGPELWRPPEEAE